MWEFPALYVTELECQDGRCRVASEKQGHQGHTPPNIGDGAHLEYWRGLGLVKLWAPPKLPLDQTGQIQGLEGAVEHQFNSEVVLAVHVTDSFRKPPVPRPQMARE